MIIVMTFISSVLIFGLVIKREMNRLLLHGLEREKEPSLGRRTLEESGMGNNNKV